MRAIEDDEAKAALLRDYALLQNVEPARQPRVDFVSEHFAGSDRDDLLTLIQALSEADIVRTFAIADEQATIYQFLLASKLGNEICACQEDVPWNSLEGLGARIKEIGERFPAPGNPAFAAAAYRTLTECAAFEQVRREGFHRPVVSDIPTLILNGTLDIQTSCKRGGIAAETLSNARNCVIPEAGHGTISCQPCANDISVAFINDPGAELDTDCIAGLTPRFVLPDGSISGGPE